MEKIKGLQEFLKIEFGSGYIYGPGDSNGSGYGDYDFGSGYSLGSGDGNGHGSGSGDDKGRGSGSGDGHGSGIGHGSGYGYGSGRYDCFSNNISVFNNDDVYMIDQIPTIIKSIKGNIAKGFILNSNFTLSKCFVVKDGNLFAHGKTLKEAMQSLNEKKWANLNTNEIIAEFCKKFEKGKSYKGLEFFKWHHYLTGSCLQGREAFVKNHNLNLDDEFTVEEFIKLTEEDYGSEIIKQLKEIYDKSIIIDMI